MGNRTSNLSIPPPRTSSGCRTGPADRPALMQPVCTGTPGCTPGRAGMNLDAVQAQKILSDSNRGMECAPFLLAQHDHHRVSCRGALGLPIRTQGGQTESRPSPNPALVHHAKQPPQLEQPARLPAQVPPEVGGRPPRLPPEPVQPRRGIQGSFPCIPAQTCDHSAENVGTHGTPAIATSSPRKGDPRKTPPAPRDEPTRPVLAP